MKTHGVVAWRKGHTWREDATGSYFYVNCAPYVAVKLKRLLPRADPHRSGWIVVSDTPEVARDLEWLCERYPMEMDDTTSARLLERATAHRAMEETIERILAGDRIHDDAFVTPEREPRDYQAVAADVASLTGRLLLLDVLGLGKSMSAILVLRDPKLLPAVVVCYPHLERQWAGEIAATFPWALTHAVNKGVPYDPSKLRSTGYRRPDVLIIGWSKLRGWGQHLAGEARTIIFDEVQELRTGHSSQKYTAAAQIADQALCRIGLSATPVYNYGGEIHNIVGVLAPDVLGSRPEFVREWCSSPGTDTTGEEEPRLGAGSKLRVRDPQALGLYLRDQGVMLRRTRKEVGRELPATDRIPHVVDVDEHMMDTLSAEVVDIADAYLARETSSKERFLLGGELDWKLRRLTGLSKAPYVAAFVEALLDDDPNEKVLLYGWHRDVYDQWRRRLAKHDPVFYTGTESRNQKHESFKRFTEGDSRILIASLRAGAGLDGLQGHSRTIVFGELDWSPGVHEQCIGRLERDGMGDGPVTAFFLFCESGSDPVVMSTLALKRSQSEPLIDPNADPFAPIQYDDSRVRRLAEAVKTRRKR